MDWKNDYYCVLSVNPDASFQGIKNAYRMLVKEFHPDRHPGDERCEIRMKAYVQEQAGDLEGARSTLQEGLRAFPEEVEFRRKMDRIEGEIMSFA